MLIGTISLAVVFLAGISYLNNSWNGPQKEEFVRQAKRWKDELRKQGEDPSEIRLMEVSFNTRLFPNDEIVLASFLNEDEYISLIEKLSKDKIKNYLLETGYVQTISLNMLQSAILAKRLSLSIDNLKEGMEILKAKETVRSLTKEEKEQLKSFQKMRKQYVTIFHQIISLKIKSDEAPEFKIPEFQLYHSGFVGKPKFSNRNEMLDAVRFDEDFTKIKSEDTYEEETNEKKLSESLDEKEDVKNESLALTDMKKFLLKSNLPEDISEKIRNTIQEVEDQLDEKKRKQEEEKIRMEAETLIKTAKEYHQLKK